MAINSTASPSMPGIPTSSAKPVAGKAVDVGITVVETWAAWVNKAATVAVRGSIVTTTVLVGTAITAVGVRVAVGGIAVAVRVGVNCFTVAV